MRTSLRMLVCLSLLAALPALADELEALIQEAERLNVTAPWRESQAVLDRLRPTLGDATQRQRARVEFLEARNQALAGDCAATINALAHQREGPLDADLQLAAFRLSANCALNLGHYEEGFRFLKRGLELFPEVAEPDEKIKLLGLATFYNSQAGDPEAAVMYADDALRLARESGDPRSECMAMFDLSLAQEMRKDLAAALATSTAGIPVCEQAGDPVYIGVFMVQHGEVLHQLGRSQEALAPVEEGLEWLREADYAVGVAQSELALAMVLIGLGRVDEATEILLRVQRVFEDMQNWKDVRDTANLLARAAEAGGDLEAAMAYLGTAADANEKFLDRERAMRLGLLQVEFDTRHQEQTIALLQEQNRVLELQDQTQRQRRNFITAGVIVLAVVGVLLFFLLLRSRSDRGRLLWLSEHDGLTGLRNHTAFFSRASAALKNCQRSGEPFTLILADIDYFKIVNDEHGHPAGDQALNVVGRMLRKSFGAVGEIGRIGGEEFAIALPRHDPEAAQTLVQEFCRALSQAGEDGELVPLTLSFGIAQAGAEITLENLRQTADQALYEAKRRGRNQAVVASGLTEFDCGVGAVNSAT